MASRHYLFSFQWATVRHNFSRSLVFSLPSFRCLEVKLHSEKKARTPDKTYNMYAQNATLEFKTPDGDSLSHCVCAVAPVSFSLILVCKTEKVFSFHNSRKQFSFRSTQWCFSLMRMNKCVWYVSVYTLYQKEQILAVTDSEVLNARLQNTQWKERVKERATPTVPQSHGCEFEIF